ATQASQDTSHVLPPCLERFGTAEVRGGVGQSSRPGSALASGATGRRPSVVITILDVLRHAASDEAFAARFASDPLGAAGALGLTGPSGYTSARLEALARPVEHEPSARQLEQAADELRACFGLAPAAAATEAARARFFLRDYRFHQRLLAE